MVSTNATPYQTNYYFPIDPLWIFMNFQHAYDILELILPLQQNALGFFKKKYFIWV